MDEKEKKQKQLEQVRDAILSLSEEDRARLDKEYGDLPCWNLMGCTKQHDEEQRKKKQREQE